MAEDGAKLAVGRVLWILQIRRDSNYRQTHYDSLMANAEAEGFFNSTRPAPDIPYGDADPWKPGLTVVHMRGGFQFVDPAWLGMPVWVGDQLITGPNNKVAIEFMIGGRVGINVDSWVKIVTERSVADVSTSVKRLVLRKGSVLTKAARQQEPLEIQTNGGIMGIKG